MCKSANENTSHEKITFSTNVLRYFLMSILHVVGHKLAFKCCHFSLHCVIFKETSCSPNYISDNQLYYNEEVNWESGFRIIIRLGIKQDFIYQENRLSK